MTQLTPNEKTEFRFVVQTISEKDHGQFSGDLPFPEIINLLQKQYEIHGDNLVHVGITRWRHNDKTSSNCSVQPQEAHQQKEAINFSTARTGEFLPS